MSTTVVTTLELTTLKEQQHCCLRNSGANQVTVCKYAHELRCLFIPIAMSGGDSRARILINAFCVS